MAEIFISFIHEEEGLARAVQGLIQEKLGRKQTPFLSCDKWQIYAGENWLERIKAELGSAKVVVLLLSPRSVARSWVNFEAGAAWMRGIVLIPTCYAGLDRGSIPKPYASYQAVDLEEASGPYYLITSICHHFIPPFLAPPPFECNDRSVAALVGELEKLH